MSETKPAGARPRIQGLSDLIFGLALSIGAIQLVSNAPSNITGLNTDLLAFGFSFLILINIWNRYNTLAQVVPVETVPMFRLNVLLLFLVVIEPFLFNLLTTSSIQSDIWKWASSYYGLDIAAMNLVLAFFAHLVTRQEKNFIPAEQRDRFKVSRNGFTAVGLLFAISAIPLSAFWNVFILTLPLRIFLWILTVPVIWISRILSKQP